MRDFSLCCTIFGFIAIVVTITGSIIFGLERHKENNFIENYCLVIDAVAIQHSCSKNICYAPVWTLEYNDTTTILNSSQNRVRITGSYSEKYAEALDELEKYPVSIVYCTFFANAVHVYYHYLFAGWLYTHVLS